jgi:GTPase SAR1 family protein
VGNKSDLEDKREVSKESVQKLIKDLDIDLYYETSAKNGENVEKLFVEASKYYIMNIPKLIILIKKEFIIIIQKIII